MQAIALPSRRPLPLQGMSFKYDPDRGQRTLQCFVVASNPLRAFSDRWVHITDVSPDTLLAFIRSTPVIFSQHVIEYFVRLEAKQPWVIKGGEKEEPVTIVPFPGHYAWPQLFVQGQVETLLAARPTESEMFILTTLTEKRTEWEDTIAEELARVCF